MSSIIINECPICMDDIFQDRNCITTECGHCFHASCLMTNISHRGFGCPYCRREMAKEPEEDLEDEEDLDEDDSEYEDYDEDTAPDDYALRGLRFFMNRLEGVEDDAEDIEEEANVMPDLYDQQGNIVTENDLPQDAPSTQMILQQLLTKFTQEDLVIALLENHSEYCDSEFISNRSGEVFGKIRHIITRHQQDARRIHNQTQEQEQEPGEIV